MQHLINIRGYLQKTVWHKCIIITNIVNFAFFFFFWRIIGYLKFIKLFEQKSHFSSDWKTITLSLMGKVKIVWYFITQHNIQIKNNYSTETKKNCFDILSLIQIFKLKKQLFNRNSKNIFWYFIINNNVQIKKTTTNIWQQLKSIMRNRFWCTDRQSRTYKHIDVRSVLHSILCVESGILSNHQILSLQLTTRNITYMNIKNIILY